MRMDAPTLTAAAAVAGVILGVVNGLWNGWTWWKKDATRGRVRVSAKVVAAGQDRGIEFEVLNNAGHAINVRAMAVEHNAGRNWVAHCIRRLFRRTRVISASPVEPPGSSFPIPAGGRVASWFRLASADGTHMPHGKVGYAYRGNVRVRIELSNKVRVRSKPFRVPPDWL
jgi:hypothetical protein